MDATDNELLEAQYYGCCVVDLYLQSRTHLALEKDALISRRSPGVGREDRRGDSLDACCFRRIEFLVATPVRHRRNPLSHSFLPQTSTLFSG